MNSVGKNIVICCDGTGNDYSRTPSNVWRLRELLLGCRDEQPVCYEPGIGTLDFTEGRTALGRRLRHWRELGFGTGIFERVAALYTYLMREYEPGDRIFLFGFSRGAFTARALAGMLHACGLLEREAEHLLPYALGLYRTSEQRIQHALRCEGLREAPRGKDHVEWDERIVTFKRALSRECQVHFIGLWDTVKAYGWIWPQSFPALRHNSSVRMVRHAVALDEKRAVFQVTGWGDRRRIKAREGSCMDAVQEVWFAGDHSDVGGGHPEGNSGLTDASLEWMLGEATHQELLLPSCDQSIHAVSSMKRGARNAHTVTPRDLRREFWATRLPPRMDLDNSTYPPHHRPAWFWTSGRRQPAMHAEEHPVLLHETVRERAPQYSWDALRRRTRAILNPEPEFDYVSSQSIVFCDCMPGSSVEGGTHSSPCDEG
jgi:uncharacterized protein (DUF2235 family)